MGEITVGENGNSIVCHDLFVKLKVFYFTLDFKLTGMLSNICV